MTSPPVSGLAALSRWGIQASIVDQSGAQTWALGPATVTADMTADTRMSWSCAGKPLWALATLVALEQCGATVDDPIETLLPDFQGDWGRRCTVRALLTHQAGIGGEFPPESCSWDDSRRSVHLQELDRNSNLVDAEVRYSDYSNWQFLALVIGALTDNHPGDFLRSAVLGPLGLGSTSIVPADDGDAAIMDLYTSEEADAGSCTLGEAMIRDLYLPGAGLVGTTRDLASFYYALSQPSLPEKVGISSALLARMLCAERVGMACTRYLSEVDWGLGIITDRRMFFRTSTSARPVGHDGNMGVASVDLDRSVSYVVLFNATCGPMQSAIRNKRGLACLGSYYRSVRDGA